MIPGQGLLKGGRRPQYSGLRTLGSYYVQSYGHGISRKPTGYAGCGLASHVDRESEWKEAPEGLNFLATDGAGRLVNLECWHGHGGAEQQVIFIKKLFHLAP